MKKKMRLGLVKIFNEMFMITVLIIHSSFFYRNFYFLVNCCSMDHICLYVLYNQDRLLNKNKKFQNLLR